MDIRVLRRDDNNKLLGPPIIEIEFEKNTLDPYIIIGGESINYEWKKADQFYVKDVSSLVTPKKSAETLQEGRVHNCGGI